MIAQTLLKFIDKFFPKKSIKLKLKLRQISKNYMTIKIKNKKILFYVKNFHCLKRYETIMTKEEATITWLDKIKKGDVFWDIGANIGIYSLYAAKIRDARVISFEPIISSAQVLRKNIDLNNLQKMINLFVIGLGKKNINLKLFYSSNHAASARHQVSPINNKIMKFENILVMNPLQLLEKKLVLFPNHIKIDTDGNELEILDSLKKVLKSSKLKSLCVENEFGKNEKYREKKINDILKGCGFLLKNKSVLTAGYNMYFEKKRK